MADFHFETMLPWKRDTIYTAFRDRMEDYALLAPNVVSVKVLERKKLSAQKLRIRARWQAKADIPFVVRSILKPDMLAWKDDVIWDEKNYTTNWTIESFFFNEFFTCEGTWTFKNLGGAKTLVKLTGNLHIYIPHLPPFPDRLVQSAGGIIEKMILHYLNPNLTQGIQALRKLLEREEK